MVAMCVYVAMVARSSLTSATTNPKRSIPGADRFGRWLRDASKMLEPHTLDAEVFVPAPPDEALPSARLMQAGVIYSQCCHKHGAGSVGQVATCKNAWKCAQPFVEC